MKPEKKKAALAIILGGMKPHKMEDEPEPESGGDVGLETAMTELMDAMKAGDAPAAASAFKSAMEMCQSSGESEDCSSDDEDDDE